MFQQNSIQGEYNIIIFSVLLFRENERYVLNHLIKVSHEEMKMVIEFNIALKIHRVDKSSIQTTQCLHEKHKNLQVLLTYTFTYLKKKYFLRYCTIKRDYTILERTRSSQINYKATFPPTLTWKI